MVTRTVVMMMTMIMMTMAVITREMVMVMVTMKMMMITQRAVRLQIGHLPMGFLLAAQVIIKLEVVHI